MQIGAANSAGGQTHNGVEIVLYRRLLDVVESNVSNSMVNDAFIAILRKNHFGDLLPGWDLMSCLPDYRDDRLCLATLAACFPRAVRVDLGK